MQGWIVLAAWVFAVLFAAVILGFTGYEVSWKLRRLQKDQARLETLAHELGKTAAQLQSSAARAGTLRQARASGAHDES